MNGNRITERAAMDEAGHVTYAWLKGITISSVELDDTGVWRTNFKTETFQDYGVQLSFYAAGVAALIAANMISAKDAFQDDLQLMRKSLLAHHQEFGRNGEQLDQYITKEIYGIVNDVVAIFRRRDIFECLEKCAQTILAENGLDSETIERKMAMIFDGLSQ